MIDVTTRVCVPLHSRYFVQAHDTRVPHLGSHSHDAHCLSTSRLGLQTRQRACVGFKMPRSPTG